MSISAMKQALEALERSVATCFDQYAHTEVMSRPEHFVNQAITALSQAIEQAEKQEPVAYAAMIDGEIAWDADYPFSNEPFSCFDDEQSVPLYTAPPQRQPLLASDIVTMYEENPRSDSEMIAFARAIEAKLKEKNT